MTCAQCEGIEEHFDSGVAERDLDRYRSEGATGTTQLLIDDLRNLGIAGNTLLDIGGGIGVIQLELLAAGVREAAGVDASSSYIGVVKRQVANSGLVDRSRQILGDFVEVAEDLAPADIVTLDRVICCYHDYRRLIQLSTACSKRLYAVAYPRDGWWAKALIFLENLLHRARGSSFRAFVHPVGEIKKLIEARGFLLSSERISGLWRIEVYARPSLAGSSLA